MSEFQNHNRSSSKQPLDRPLLLLVTNESWASDLLRTSVTSDIAQLEIIRRDDHSFQRIRRDAPSVIAVELTGPGAQGFDLLRELAAHEDTSDIPCIAMAPLPDPLIRAAAFKESAEEFMSRLSEPDEVRMRVNTLAKLGMAKLQVRMADAEMSALQKRLDDRVHLLTDSESKVKYLEKSLGTDTKLLRNRVDGLVNIGIKLHEVQDIDLLMDLILSEARNLIGADAGTVYFLEKKKLRFAYMQNDTMKRRRGDMGATLSMPTSENSIAGWVGVSGESLNIANAYALEPGCPYQFDSTFDSMTGYKTQSVLALPLRTSSKRTVGVLQLINATDSDGRARPRFTEEDQALLSHFASMATVAIERSQLTEINIKRMLSMMEMRDPIETGPHNSRVVGISVILYEEYARCQGWDGPDFERKRARLRVAASLHDVGKVAVSDLILKKAGKLNAAEYEKMKEHVLWGATLFGDHEFDETTKEVVLNHHERWDGGGYPGYIDLDGNVLIDPITRQPKLGGKKGEDIPLSARVVALADVFDALSHKRCYKEAWLERRVLDTIRAEAGKQFDPELVRIFFEKWSDIRDIRQLHLDD